MDVVLLENTFQSIIKPLTGLSKFIPAQRPQGAPEPALPYATYEIVSTNELGRHQYSPLDDAGDQEVYEHYEVIFKVTIIGSGATKVAHDISLGIGKQTVSSALFENNLAYSRKSNVRRIPKLVSSSWEERAEILITCFTVSQATDNIGIIERAEITENYTSDSGVEYTDTFVVDINITP